MSDVLGVNVPLTRDMPPDQEPAAMGEACRLAIESAAQTASRTNRTLDWRSLRIQVRPGTPAQGQDRLVLEVHAVDPFLVETGLWQAGKG